MVMGGTNRVSGISVTGIGFAQMERMERIFYRGFMYYLVPSSNFSDAREATIRAARELYGAGGVEEQTVRAGDVPAAVEFGRVAAAPVNTLRQQTHRCQEISVCF